MGKEIVKSRIPDKPNKEISFKEKAVRTGLVPLTIATLALSGCSQEPTAPQAPAGVSGNSSRFPNVNNDRPLQTPREPPKPTPTQEKETQALTKIFESKNFSKKPEDLYVDLLKTPISKNIPNALHSEITINGYTTGQLDEVSKLLKAMGQVKITFSKNNPWGQGVISYTIFPDSSNAKNAYDIVANNFPISTRMPIVSYASAYPLFIATSNPTNSYANHATIGASVKNVLVTVQFSELSSRSASDTSINPINLPEFAIGHLLTVGR